MSDRKRKLSVTLGESTWDVVQDLMPAFDGSVADVFASALALMHWAHEEIKAGRYIMSMPQARYDALGQDARDEINVMTFRKE